MNCKMLIMTLLLTTTVSFNPLLKNQVRIVSDILYTRVYLMYRADLEIRYTLFFLLNSQLLACTLESEDGVFYY